MNEAVAYIFGSLRASETAIKDVGKALAKQARFNRNLTAFALAMAAYVVVVEIYCYEQSKRIGELSDEIEELKRMKGA